MLLVCMDMGGAVGAHGYGALVLVARRHFVRVCLLYVCGDVLTVQEKVLFCHAREEWVFFWAVRVTGAISNRERRRATNVIDGRYLGFRVSGFGFRV